MRPHLLTSLAALALVAGCSSNAEEGVGQEAPAVLDVSACQEQDYGRSAPTIEVEENSVSITQAEDPADDMEAGLILLGTMGCVVEELGAPAGTSDVLLAEGDAAWSGFTATYSETPLSGAVIIVQRA